jgi:hypothetical protein
VGIRRREPDTVLRLVLALLALTAADEGPRGIGEQAGVDGPRFNLQ